MPPIENPSSIVIKMLGINSPKQCKNKKLIPTETSIINTFLDFNRMVKNLKIPESCCQSKPKRLQVALSYIIIFPIRQDPKIEVRSNNIVMQPDIFLNPCTYKQVGYQNKKEQFRTFMHVELKINSLKSQVPKNLPLLNAMHSSIVILFSSSSESTAFSPSKAQKSLDLSSQPSSSMKKYKHMAATRLRMAKMSIVTSHLHLKMEVRTLPVRKAQMFPMQVIEVQNPTVDPYFLECQCLDMRESTTCQAARWEKPYPIIARTMAQSKATMVRPLLTCSRSFSWAKMQMKGITAKNDEILIAVIRQSLVRECCPKKAQRKKLPIPQDMYTRASRIPKCTGVSPKEILRLGLLQARVILHAWFMAYAKKVRRQTLYFKSMGYGTDEFILGIDYRMIQTR